MKHTEEVVASSVIESFKNECQPDTGSPEEDIEKKSISVLENYPSTVSADENQATDPNIVDWDGPNDPENPLNWTTTRKVAAIATVSLITFLSPLASTIISSSTSAVLTTFHSTNATLGALVTTVYLIGYAFGPLVIAPLSELYGRQVNYNVCNFIFLAFNVACARAGSLSALIAFRFLAGLGASCPVTLGAGTIADLVPVEHRGRAMVGWIMGPVVGPTIGPLVGSYLAQAKGWRWVFWLVSILAGVVFVANVWLMPETYAYTLLQRKTKRLRKETGNPNLRSVLDTDKDPRELFKRSIFRPLKMLFLSPIVFLLSLYMATIYGYMYLLFTTFPRVFQGQYHFSDGSVGLAYLGVGCGCICGLIFCGTFSDRVVMYLTKRNGGEPKPEYRVPVMFAGVFFVPAGLFLYGWAAEYKVQWFVPILGTALLGGGMFIVYMPGATYLVDAYTAHAASANAAATVFRSALGAVLPLAGAPMYNKLGIGWGTSVLGFIATAFIPVPLIFWIYGERIRTSKLFNVKF